MKLFAGIDGGQSGTQAVIADEAGDILGRGVAGPCDEVAEAKTSRKAHDALNAAMHAALADAGLPATTRMECIVAGISGYDGAFVGRTPKLATKRFVPVHDAPVAHVAAFGGASGIVVIAGTGSVVLGVVDERQPVLVGGWSSQFGDEGGAYWIGREAIRQTMACEDAGVAPDSVARVALRAFKTKSAREIVSRVSAGKISRCDIAALAKPIMALAARNETDAVALIDEAIEHLLDDALLTLERLEAPTAEIAFVGGLMRNRWYAQRVQMLVDELDGRFSLVAPAHDPAVGALLMAYTYAEVPLPPRVA